MGRIVAVVFDWAGTMIDFGCMAPVAAMQRALAAEGVPVTEAQVRAPMGRAKRDHVSQILAMPEVAKAWAAVHGAPSSEVDIDRIHDALGPLMREAAIAHGELIRGTAEVAAGLVGAGVKVGACTGYTREMMAPILPMAAAQGYDPAVTICAGETAHGRPSPLMLWKALATLEAWPAHACVKVDDAPVGVAEGVAGGVWSVGVAASGNEVGLSAADLAALAPAERRARIDAAAAVLRAAGADYVIDTIADLPSVLADIEARLGRGERPSCGA